MTEETHPRPGRASVGPPERFTAEELEERRAQRREAARRIDLQTANAYWTHEHVLDPYGDYNLSPGEECVGRCFWLFDPVERFWITEADARALHPEIPDVAWRRFMRSALARFDSLNPPSTVEIEFASTVGRRLGYGMDGYPRESEELENRVATDEQPQEDNAAGSQPATDEGKANETE